MVAAIYARKSAEQNGLADEQKSVTRQIDHARAYASRKGWAVSDQHIYVDDGISGAEFANRPGFVRLMNALKPRPPFQALVMSEESRLGREMVETMGALKQIVTAGVRVFYYLEDKERTLDSPIEKTMMALETFGAELEREKTRQRVIDAMTRNARRGHWCGGDCYGYDRVEEFGEPDAAGRRVRQCVRLRVNETEATVVRQIFALCARGLGTRRVAKHLNAEGAPAPRPKCGRPRSWAPSSVGEILNRPLYRGDLVWNRNQKRDKWGKKDTQPRPEAQ
jgi:DNA invertase Pin-like site-specific DNA recombinase